MEAYYHIRDLVSNKYLLDDSYDSEFVFDILDSTGFDSEKEAIDSLSHEALDDILIGKRIEIVKVYYK